VKLALLTFHAAAALSALAFILAIVASHGFTVGPFEGWQGEGGNVSVAVAGPAREDWEVQAWGISIGAIQGVYVAQLGDGWAFGATTILPVVWVLWLTFRLAARRRWEARGFDVQPSVGSRPT
jgi:hypothetical protein